MSIIFDTIGVFLSLPTLWRQSGGYCTGGRIRRHNIALTCFALYFLVKVECATFDAVVLYMSSIFPELFSVLLKALFDIGWEL